MQELRIHTSRGFPWLTIALVEASEEGVSSTCNCSSCCAQVLRSPLHH
ncbi:MAG: hypothetical protein ACK56F_24870 [bacterium]